jgi:hypothetical protein
MVAQSLKRARFEGPVKERPRRQSSQGPWAAAQWLCAQSFRMWTLRPGTMCNVSLQLSLQKKATTMKHCLNPSLEYADLGTELVVCDPTTGTVVRLRGDDAAAVRQLVDTAGDHDPGPTASRVNQATLDRLAEVGIVLHDVPPANLSRRRMLRLTAAGAAAAGLAVLVLPNAAAASSSGPGPNPGPDPGPTIPSEGPSGADVITEVSPSSLVPPNTHLLTIRWEQGSWPTAFSYTIAVKVNGNQIDFGGSSTVTRTSSDTFNFFFKGSSWEATMTSLTSPSTVVVRSGTT